MIIYIIIPLSPLFYVLVYVVVLFVVVVYVVFAAVALRFVEVVGALAVAVEGVVEEGPIYK